MYKHLLQYISKDGKLIKREYYDVNIAKAQYLALLNNHFKIMTCPIYDVSLDNSTFSDWIKPYCDYTDEMIVIDRTDYDVFDMAMFRWLHESAVEYKQFKEIKSKLKIGESEYSYVYCYTYDFPEYNNSITFCCDSEYAKIIDSTPFFRL